MTSRSRLFEDISAAADYWTGIGTDAITNTESDLRWVDDRQPFETLQKALGGSDAHSAAVRKALFECLVGFSNSVMAVFDGATELAESGRIYLVDSKGVRLKDGLGQDLMAHLKETGRLKWLHSSREHDSA